MARWWTWALGAAALVVPGVALAFRRQPDESEASFVAKLPRYAQPFGAFVYRSAQRWSVDPWLLARVIDLESQFGEALTPRGPGGTGDHGHGRGLAQVDDRTWGEWLNEYDWQDPATNIDKGAQILSANLRMFSGNVKNALAAYNAGPSKVMHALSQGVDPATVTSKASNGLFYPDNVLRRLGG